MRTREDIKQSALEILLLALAVCAVFAPFVVLGLFFPWFGNAMGVGIMILLLGGMVFLAIHWLYELGRDWWTDGGRR